MTDLNCISVEWRAIALQTYSQSHIRLFLIIVIKVGKVYSSLSVGCWNTGLCYLWSLLCSRTKKPWRLPTRQVLINAQRTNLYRIFLDFSDYFGDVHHQCQGKVGTSHFENNWTVEENTPCREYLTEPLKANQQTNPPERLQFKSYARI